MDLSLNDTQQLIQDSARDFVRGACKRDVLLELDRNPAVMKDRIWREMAALGWTGMAIPEAYGGTGNPLTDVAVLCARIVAEAAGEETKQAWLPRIASGERVFALAFTEAQYGWSANHVRLTAKPENGGYRVTGTKVYVHDAFYATDLLVAARVDNGLRLLRVDANAPGVKVRPLAGFLTHQCEVTLYNVRVSAADVVDAGESLAGALL